MHVIEVLEYRTICGAPWAKVRTGQQPKPEWRPLAELVVAPRLAELRTLTSTLGQRTEQDTPTQPNQVNNWHAPKPLRSDVAGHYGGHEYRVPRGQS